MFAEILVRILFLTGIPKLLFLEVHVTPFKCSDSFLTPALHLAIMKHRSASFAQLTSDALMVSKVNFALRILKLIFSVSIFRP